MDLLDTLLYTLARIGLMIMLVLFGAFVGEILFAAIASFLPYSALSFKEFLIDDTVQSAAAMIVVCLLFIWIFYEDGKRHTAYENWSVVNITIVMLIMLMVYFVPAIFRDSFNAEGRADVFYRILYYPCAWAEESTGGFLTAVVAATLAMLAAAFSAYFISYKRYVKKHPSLLFPKAVSDDEALDDEELD